MKFAEIIFDKLITSHDHIWIYANDVAISYGQTLIDIDECAEIIKSFGVRLEKSVLGIAMKTSYEFVVSDLMAIKNNAITLPIPLDFDDEQIRSLLKNVSCVLVADDSDGRRILEIFPDKTIVNVHDNTLINKARFESNQVHIPNGVIKIIHTSGTTSNPKGVMIKDEAMVILINSLLDRFPRGPLKYLSLVPMSLLIEQVLGIYCPLLSGGSLTLLPSNMKEFGSQFNDSCLYLDLVKQYKPNFLYLAPKLLDLIDNGYDVGDALDNSYIITGGTKINHETIKSLYEKNIRVYEGYGLSENSSVVSINGVDDWKIGTAGKLLPHIDYKIVDGELLIKSETMCAGYFSTDDSSCEISDDGYLHTGDLVEFDGEYLVIKGRKKHVLILSNARNISPEWVELKLKKFDSIYDCIVIGDGLDYLYAIIMPSHSSKSIVTKPIISSVNSELPEFAKIGKTVVIDNIEEFRNKYYTVTGRPRRSLIHKEFIHDRSN